MSGSYHILYPVSCISAIRLKAGISFCTLKLNISLICILYLVIKHLIKLTRADLKDISTSCIMHLVSLKKVSSQKSKTDPHITSTPGYHIQYLVFKHPNKHSESNPYHAPELRNSIKYPASWVKFNFAVCPVHRSSHHCYNFLILVAHRDIVDTGLPAEFYFFSLGC